ncbi:MAG: RNA polymerase sigma factor [Nocardiopsaceae bacterium]|jgi:RNA polymerase sigma-70 factor (ECF subfamily)|nr:RNA polymerase sigma factor [Nocardiopsaceae bacterium]
MAEDPGARQTTIGADEGVREMVDQHGPAIYRLAVSIVRDPALAEDVAQETFIMAWRHRDTYRGVAPLRHWLLRIAHNVAVSTLRSLREEARDPSTLPGGHAEVVESTVANRMAVEEALSLLDPLSRSIVVLREMEGLSYAEIGQILGVALPTVKTRLFRARATLREIAGEVRS